MSIPARPLAALHEGPATSCVIHGQAIGWKNCTPTSIAMGISKATMHAKNPSPCGIRIETGDTSGGTTLPQCAAVADREHGVKLEVRVGANVCSPGYAAGKAAKGQGFALQGNAGVLVGTSHRSTRGNVNHCVYANQVRGGTASVPDEALVFDPAADGRTTSWGKAATSPQWWPWSLVLKFAAALRPASTDGGKTGAVLGPGKFYAGIFPDTEPHVHLRFVGSVRTSPFPQTLTVKSPTAGRKVNVRSGPSKTYPIVQTLASGTHFAAYQRNAKGQLLSGSRLWYGDHNGKLWIHSSGVKA